MHAQLAEQAQKAAQLHAQLVEQLAEQAALLALREQQVEKLEEELDAQVQRMQGIKPLDLPQLSMRDSSTKKEQRAAAAGALAGAYKRRKQLDALLDSGVFGQGAVPGCAAAALCCFFVSHKMSSVGTLEQVHRRLSLIVHTDKCVLGDDEEMQLNAMKERLTGLLEG